jgi:hypothetical protein
MEHLGIGYCRGITLTLEFKLRLIHAARHIHGQYEKQVDLLGSVGEWELSQGQRHQRQYTSNDPAHGCVPEVVCSSRGCDETGSRDELRISPEGRGNRRMMEFYSMPVHRRWIEA